MSQPSDEPRPIREPSVRLKQGVQPPDIAIDLLLPIPHERYQSWTFRRSEDSSITMAEVDEALEELRGHVWELLYGD